MNEHKSLNLVKLLQQDTVAERKDVDAEIISLCAMPQGVLKILYSIMADDTVPSQDDMNILQLFNYVHYIKGYRKTVTETGEHKTVRNNKWVFDQFKMNVVLASLFKGEDGSILVREKPYKSVD